MGERKVLNKYYPPDFDPAFLANPANKIRRTRDRQIKVRVMLPFTCQCTGCGDFVYRGTKFNARKEWAKGEDYLGIKRWRFYIKCGSCMQEIIFKTDPKNTDYECEAGALRNFEPWRQQRLLEGAAKILKKDQEIDAMVSLENRTEASKREMDALDALEELQEINQRQANLNTDKLLEAHARIYESKDPTKLDAADEAVINSIDFKSEQKVKRLDKDNTKSPDAKPSMFANLAKKTSAPANGVAAGVVAVVKKRKKNKTSKHEKKAKRNKKEASTGTAPAPTPAPKVAVNSLGLAKYASSSDED